MTDDDKALVERLRTNQCADNMGCNPLAPYCQCAFMDDAADRIEGLSAENERLRQALTQIARLRTDLRGDFSLGSKQSDIARAALGQTE